MLDEQAKIRVFISYAHQDEQHSQQVRLLAGKLRAAGIHSILDQYETAPEQGWRVWMETEAHQAEFVLVVCSKVYFERASQRASATEGRGVRFESALLLDELYNNGMVNQKLIPVFFRGEDEKFIPSSLRSYTRYQWDRDHESLLRHLTNQPAIPVPEVAPELVVLPPRSDAPKVDPPTESTISELPDNPFTDVKAVRDPEAVVGREKEFRRLRSLLAGGSVNLFGPPKIGKSTLLFQTVRYWDGQVLGPFDLHLLTSVDELFAQLADGLGCADASWRSVREALRIGRRLIVFDEMDASPRLGLGSEDLQRWRALETENPDLHWLMASRRPLKEIFPDQPEDGSPGYNLIQPLPLGPLSSQAAKRLLAHPWNLSAPEFSDEVIEEMVSDLAAAGCPGHPCWIQRAGHHRYEALADPEHDWRAEWRRDRSLMT